MSFFGLQHTSLFPFSAEFFFPFPVFRHFFVLFQLSAINLTPPLESLFSYILIITHLVFRCNTKPHNIDCADTKHLESIIFPTDVTFKRHVVHGAEQSFIEYLLNSSINERKHQNVDPGLIDAETGLI